MSLQFSLLKNKTIEVGWHKQWVNPVLSQHPCSFILLMLKTGLCPVLVRNDGKQRKQDKHLEGIHSDQQSTGILLSCIPGNQGINKGPCPQALRI